MRKAKTLYILLGVLFVSCVATFAISKYETKKEEIKNSDEIILAIDPDTVTALSWEYDDESLAFHKDEKWLYDADENFPVDEEKITELLNIFQEFGAAFIIENVEDFGQYGLDDPVCTVTISADEEEYVIELGDYSTMDSERYFSIGDGNVYLASEDPYDDYELVISDMVKHDEIPELTEADKIVFSGDENYTITYEEDSLDTYCADDVYFTNHQPLDTTLVENYLNEISNLSLSEYVSYNVTDEELEKYGLINPELTITVEYTLENEDGEKEEKTFELSIGRNQEELAAALEDEEEDVTEDTETEEDASQDVDDENETAIEAESEDNDDTVTAYARVGDSQIVYQIGEVNFENLMEASYDDLRHKEVLTASFDDIYRIDISLEGETYTITSEDSEDEEEKIWHYSEDEELETAPLFYAIQSLTADRFTTEIPSGKEEISFTVYLDNDKYPQIRVEIYRYDGSQCIAVVDDEPISFVSRSCVVDLIEAVNAIVLN